MADNKNTSKKPQQPKDLPAKPSDKKTDDKVRGGLMKKTSYDS